ncbi:GNAT family N-acetyltransferase [Nitratireductor pacificus]|uniref:Ribosomal-protein-alanine N-acetyltransferase n=1 Tax=Nitratireductor pacificus pht-3B TaxID=391937 RepID=K2MCG6_9HYPH|nr:GNAT family protein [Nitratireductor pacificus]EKF19861.1 ribosomal-protein-alanine N-acetyltransferase [Nitratireductor pacificus pht-3B]
MLDVPFLRRQPPALKGERLILRMPTMGDHAAWAALRNESRSFLEPWEPRWAPDELSRAAFRQRLRRYRSEFDQGTGIAFFLFDARSDTLTGGITLSNIRRGVAQTGSIGYWMGQRFAGRGMMLEAVRMVIPFAFETLRLHRLEAACIPDNDRSVGLLEKAGFQREGLLKSYLRINGSWRDHYLYALVAEERRVPASEERG